LGQSERGKMRIRRKYKDEVTKKIFSERAKERD
jgi:hypothetical protein